MTKKEAEMTEKKDCVVMLECFLTDEERLNYSQEMATQHQALREKEDSKKRIMKDFAAEIQSLEAEINVLSRKITTRREQRDVNCFWEFDYNIGEKTLVRKDTGEEVKKETISVAERQRYLDFDKDEKGPEDDLSEPCGDCGAPAGESCSKDCPGESEPSCPEDESAEPPEDKVGPDSEIEETAGELPEEVSEEEVLEEEKAAEGETEEDEPQTGYQCAECKKHFDTPGESEDGSDETHCVHCGSTDWF